MKILFAAGLAFAAMATTTLAQQPPAPPAPPPAVQAPLTAVPEVMPATAPPAPDQDVPPPPPGPRDMAMRGHDGHRPPPPSKAAHFRVESGHTKIDVKCADDEPTKVCADVVLQIMDKLAPAPDRSDDDRY